MWQVIGTHMPKWNVWMEAFFLFIIPLIIFLTVRQIRAMDGRESRRMERLKLLEEEDRSQHADHDPSVSEAEKEKGTFTEDYEANVAKIRQAVTDMSDVNERSIFLEKLNAVGTLFLWMD